MGELVDLLKNALESSLVPGLAQLLASYSEILDFLGIPVMHFQGVNREVDVSWFRSRNGDSISLKILKGTRFVAQN